VTRAWLLLVVAMPALASADASLDVIGGPLVLGAQSTASATGQAHQSADHDWHAHLGGGFALRAHDIAKNRAIDLELGWDRFSWHDADYDFADVYRYRFTLTTWREYRHGDHLFELSAGGGLELLGGHIHAIDHAGSGDIDNVVVRARSTGIAGTARATYLVDIGPIDLGLELVGTLSLDLDTIEGDNLSPNVEYYAGELQLRAVVRI
jgi:hypothetical protein